MTGKTIGKIAAALMLMTAPALAQTAPPVGPDLSKVEIKTTDLGNRTYMLVGTGGNTTVALGEDGVIMVDGQFAPLHEKLKAAIAELSPQPIKFLVNTHHHSDHSGGNARFAESGVTVVAHVNARNRLASGTTHNLSGAATPPAPEIALPKQTHTDGTSLELKGRTVQLKHARAAHTDGDTYVHFADANVIATGDTVTIGRYPNIDFANGGTIKGVIDAVDTYLALANDSTKIVPGHGPLADKAKLADYRAMLIASRDRMAKLISEGKSEAEIQAMKPFADLDASWAVNDQAARTWVRVVYVTVSRQ